MIFARKEKWIIRPMMCFGIALLLMLSFFGATAAHAANTADTTYMVDITTNTSKNTASRPKGNTTKVYLKCVNVAGSGSVRANGLQDGKTYSYGPKYAGSKGTKYLTNYVLESRPNQYKEAYAYLQFSNNNTLTRYHSDGVWSPDNSSGY